MSASVLTFFFTVLSLFAPAICLDILASRGVFDRAAEIRPHEALLSRTRASYSESQSTGGKSQFLSRAASLRTEVGSRVDAAFKSFDKTISDAGSTVLDVGSQLLGDQKAGVDSGPHRRQLTQHELRTIKSVDCLQLKRLDPSVDCNRSTGAVPAVSWSQNTSEKYQLDAGNFPSYTEPACQSGGAFICDPQAVLNSSQRVELASELKTAREDAPVSCGNLAKHKADDFHYEPFYLGVVILEDWPVAQANPAALQALGQVVAGKWHMESPYTGDGHPFARCPNTGVLIILPTIKEAYLSTADCEYLCQAEGGAQVTGTVVAALRRGNTTEAAIMGVRAVSAYLQGRFPSNDWRTLSGEEKEVHEPTYEAAATQRSGGPFSTGARVLGLDSPGGGVNLVQRLLFTFAVGLLIFSMGVGLLVMCWAPGLAIKRRLQ